MFRLLIPRQHGNITTATSVLSQVFKDCNRTEPLKHAAGAWNSCRFVKTEKGLPGGTIKETIGSFSKMANRNEEEYFYNKTKTELEELKKRIRDEPFQLPVKRKLEEKALNLDLQLKRMDLRGIIQRAEEDRLSQQQEKKEIDPKQKPELNQKHKPEDPKPKSELETKQLNKTDVQWREKKSDIKKSTGNKIHYASDGKVPLQHPPNQRIDKEQQAAEPKRLRQRSSTQPEPLRMLPDQKSEDEAILKKRVLERERSLQIDKPNIKDVKDKVDVVNKLQKPPKVSHMQKVLKKHIDLSKLGRNKKGGKGQLRRGSALQKAIEEAEQAFKDLKKKK